LIFIIDIKLINHYCYVGLLKKYDMLYIWILQKYKVTDNSMSCLPQSFRESHANIWL